MPSLGLDLRYAFRMLVKYPAVTLVAIFMLAVGIGANTAIYSVIKSVLLDPLPYRDADRLVAVTDRQPGIDDAPSSYPEFLLWRDQPGLFSECATSFISRATLSGEGEPESLRTLRVSANLLPMLGARPILGRGFEPAEEAATAERVALIGEALWRGRFGGDRDILGRSILLDGEPFTVIGVVPATFRFRSDVAIYVPLRLDTERAPLGLHFMLTVARLREGLSIAQAQIDADAIANRLQKENLTE